MAIASLLTISKAFIQLIDPTKCIPQAVQCFRVKAEKNFDRQMRKIRSLASDIFDAEDLWFRGLTLAALTCTVAFFIPAIATKTHDNEFGPGFYTKDDFPYALAYSTSTGAIMVFKKPDLRELKVWEPNIDQWNQLTATWTLSPQSGVSDKFPREYQDADFIRGSISEFAQKGKLPNRSDEDQPVAVSYKDWRDMDFLDCLSRVLTYFQCSGRFLQQGVCGVVCIAAHNHLY